MFSQVSQENLQSMTASIVSLQLFDSIQELPAKEEV